MFLDDLQKRHLAVDRPIPFTPIGLYLVPGLSHQAVMLRDLFETGDLAAASKPKAIIEFVLKTGLEPFIAPEPLPPIDEDDVQLIAWIALECEV